MFWILLISQWHALALLSLLHIRSTGQFPFVAPSKRFLLSPVVVIASKIDLEMAGWSAQIFRTSQQSSPKKRPCQIKIYCQSVVVEYSQHLKHWPNWPSFETSRAPGSPWIPLDPLGSPWIPMEPSSHSSTNAGEVVPSTGHLSDAAVRKMLSWEQKMLVSWCFCGTSW